MTTGFQPQRLAGPQADSARPALLAMLEARSVAIVGASARPGSFGARMLAEVGKSPARPTIYPVNPRYPDIDGHRCYSSLADLPAPVDLVLLGVPDASLEEQLTLAAAQSCRSAVIFGNAHGEPGNLDSSTHGVFKRDHPAGGAEALGSNPSGSSPPPLSPAGSPAPAGLTPAASPSEARPPHLSPAGAPVPAGLAQAAPPGTPAGDRAPARPPGTLAGRTAAGPPGTLAGGRTAAGPPGTLAGGSATAFPRPAAGLQSGAGGSAAGGSGAALPSLRERLAAIAMSAGMELCGAGCMGFANAGYGLRAMGYVEPDPLPAGPVALVTHSGSVFSALLRTRRAFGFTLAVSSGQELVTAAPSYLSYALGQPETRVLALVLEALRQPDELRKVLAHAAERDIPVVLLTAGNSASGRSMVAAHSGALAGSDAGWEALTRYYGLHRVTDLTEMSDTLELFSLRTRRIRRRGQPEQSHSQRAIGVDGTSTPIEWGGCAIHTNETRAQHKESARASAPTATPATPAAPEATAAADVAHVTRGIATVHDSGLERAHAADVAEELGVPFAVISEATKAKLTELLDPGLLPTNPLDVWGTGADTRELFSQCLVTLAGDESVDAVALAVDLITELDGDDSYPLAVLDAANHTDKPLAVVSNLPSGIDQDAAALLRRNGIPVLEGMRTGMLALRHLLRQLEYPRPSPGGSAGRQANLAADPARRARARKLLDEGRITGAAQLALLREYGIQAARTERVTSAAAALAAAERIGYPVVLKTDEPGIAHKSDVHGVLLDITDENALTSAYTDLASRLGPAVLVCETVPRGIELALGIVTDPDLGPLIVVGAGGILVELIADRAVALPQLSTEQAAGLIDTLAVRKLLAGVRGAPAADLGAIARAITGLADLASELGDYIEALDVNPLICGPTGAIAVDALIIPRNLR